MLDSKSVSRTIKQELSRQSVYLLPLRLFIGLGWIRASLEKFITAGWYDGSALTGFFDQQLSGGHVVFPLYQQLVTGVFEPNAVALSWIIMIGQMLVGLAVTFGVLTNFALLCGLFMNVNFVLVGAVNPSAFYIVIQTALLVTNVGAVFGLDRILSRHIPSFFLTAQPGGNSKYWQFERMCLFIGAVAAVVIALATAPYIQDYSPHSVDDPAMLMVILSGLTGLTALITALRIRSRLVAYPPRLQME